MHDLIPGDQHLHQAIGGGRFCQCWGECCIDMSTMECVCTQGCDCRTKWSPVTSYRQPEPAKTARPDHACETCGTEVYRNGTRGRFPKLCPSCKTK